MTSIAATASPETPGLEKGSPLSRWAFVFLLFYICVLFTQPQNRFVFLYPFRIALLSMAGAMVLHFFACLQDNRPVIRLGPGTILALLVMSFGLISQYFGPLQPNTAWNAYIDQLVKSSIALILVEAMVFNVYRAWVVQAMIMVATFWWIKGGLRLSAAGATWAGDRIMGPGVSMVQNPNGFAYMLCITLPIILYFYQQSKSWYFKVFFMGLALSSVYCILNTGSRTGMMIMVILAAFLVWKYFWHHKVALVVAGVALVFIFDSIGVMNIQRFQTIPNSIRNFFAADEGLVLEQIRDADEHSAVERRLKNRDTWALIKEYPILGVGMQPDQSLFTERYPHASGQVHNEILMAGKHMGFIGMGLYAGLLITLFFTGWRIELATKRWWPAMSDLGWTFKLQAVGFFVGGMFSPLPWNAFLFILVGAVSALATNLELMGVMKAREMPAYHPAAGVATPPAHARTATGG